MTCGADLNFTNVPETWPQNCTEIVEKCPNPTPAEDANYDPDPEEGAGTETSVGESLNYNCKTDHELEDGATSYKVTCAAVPKDGGYEVKFDKAPEEWEKCAAKSEKRRKKREMKIDGVVPLHYQYINVVIDVQFSDEQEYADVQ